jgi:hypothetical protein
VNPLHPWHPRAINGTRINADARDLHGFSFRLISRYIFVAQSIDFFFHEKLQIVLQIIFTLIHPNFILPDA